MGRSTSTGIGSSACPISTRTNSYALSVSTTPRVPFCSAAVSRVAVPITSSSWLALRIALYSSIQWSPPNAPPPGSSGPFRNSLMNRGSEPSKRYASRPRIPASRFQSAASERAARMTPMTWSATSARDGSVPIGPGLLGSVMLKSQAQTPRAASASKQVVAFMVGALASEVQVDGEEEAPAGRERRDVDVARDRLVAEVRHFRIDAPELRDPDQIAAAERHGGVPHAVAEHLVHRAGRQMVRERRLAQLEVGRVLDIRLRFPLEEQRSPLTPTRGPILAVPEQRGLDRKSTRLNSSHLGISYAVFCLKKKIMGRNER